MKQILIYPIRRKFPQKLCISFASPLFSGKFYTHEVKKTELPETWDIKDIVEKKNGYGLCVFEHLSPDYKEWLPLKNIIRGDIERPTRNGGKSTGPNPLGRSSRPAKADKQRKVVASPPTGRGTQQENDAKRAERAGSTSQSVAPRRSQRKR